MFRRFKLGGPSAAMIVAVIALVVALGAPSYAAQIVNSVLFAQNAGKLDGFKASRKPRPNHVLVLNSEGHIPRSADAEEPRAAVVGPQGPQGPQGLQGVQGDRGYTGSPGSALSYSVILFAPPDEGGPPVWRIDDNLSGGVKPLDNDGNFGDTGNPQPGVFCFHDLNFKVSNMVATPGRFGSNKPFDVQVDVAPPGQTLGGVDGCPAKTTAAIFVSNPTDGQLEDPPDSTDTIYFELN